MRHVRSILPAVACLFLAAGSARAQVLVETFRSSSTIRVGLPGNADAANNSTAFNGNLVPNSISFSRGVHMFRGNPVEFHGSEAAFLASTYTGSTEFSTTSGPVATSTAGTLTVAGAVNGTAVSKSHQSVDVGSGFSALNVDVVPGSSFSSFGVMPNFSSPVVPQLNGATVIMMGEFTITSVDAVNGLVHTAGKASIFARSPAADALESSNPLESNDSNLPVSLLAAGVAGMGFLLLRRWIFA